MRFKDKSYRVGIPTAAVLHDECVVKKMDTPGAKPTRGLSRARLALSILDALERGWTVVKDTNESNSVATWLIVASPETVKQLEVKHGA